MFLYSIYDKVASEFSYPIVLKNDCVAIRWFENSVSQLPAQNYFDYELYCLSDWSSEDGILSLCKRKIDVPMEEK
ncbi:nonstructural protein [Capybara microvirus Cap3_SP_188]|nr:nonstructural protein [Capybara microvirus Cap3_SP_188]